MSKRKIDSGLRRAVTEYYQWHGDRTAHPVRFVMNKGNLPIEMLLVRFTDSNCEKCSSLMIAQDWADGHWDVTEIYVFRRECEETNVEAFINSDSGRIDEIDDEEVTDDDT